MTESGVVPQEFLMAELKRVGTQQEALRKAVADAITTAHGNGQSFSVPHLKNFADPMQPIKAAAANEPEKAQEPGISARWTGGNPTSQQASDAAMHKAADLAAMQKKKAESEARAESLPGSISREQVSQAPAAPVHQSQTSTTKAAPVQEDQPYEARALPVDLEDTFVKPGQDAAAIAELLDNSGVKDRRKDLSKMQVALGGHDDTGAAAFQSSEYTFGYLPSNGDNRSKEQKKQDAKKLAVQRKEDERLKEKEKKWKAEQRRLAGIKAEEEAQEVRQKLLRAQLGPTPTTAGGQRVEKSREEKPKAAKLKEEKPKAAKPKEEKPKAAELKEEKPKAVEPSEEKIKAVKPKEEQPEAAESNEGKSKWWKIW